jgi:two-component system, LytTR family, response regulator LytT
MNVLIVEDEQLGADRLRHLLLETEPDTRILGITAGIQSTLEWLKTHPLPDLVFMDIELSDGQCFEIFNQVDLPSPIIFTTSYDEYTLQAFKVNSVDYLLKPIRKEELKKAIEKYKNLRSPSPVLDIKSLVEQLRQPQGSTAFRSRFLVKAGQRLLTLDIKEIAYFFSEDNFTFFRTWDNAKYLVEYNLEELEKMLDPSQFHRINRGFVVHVESIAEIHTYFNSRLKLHLHPATDKEVIISREKVADFKDWLGR